MIKTKRKSAFTLIELTIAMAIFAMMSVMSVQIYTNIIRMSKKVEINEYVFTEASAVMERILREVERSTIDYEEYYSWLNLDATDYGQNYGAYKAAFYDPGVGGVFNSPTPIGYSAGDGICCSTGCGIGSEYEYFLGENCTIFDIASYDVNMGSNPNTGVDPETYNALCTNSDDCDDVENSFQSELYLIDSAGTRKLMFVLDPKGNGENYISMIEMEGEDTEGDSITDYWACSDGYTCNGDVGGRDVPLADDFMPITPTNLDIIDLSFFIAPFEDPWRAFSEGEEAVQQHPHVIVTMTVGPSADLNKGYLGENWTLTLQGTASAGVYDTVPSEYRGKTW